MGSPMDLTDPIHRDCAPSLPYQTPVSAPLRTVHYSPAYMHIPAQDGTSTGQGLRQFNFPSPTIHSQLHHNSDIPSFPSFPSTHTIPQSVSETWHHRIPTFQGTLPVPGHYLVSRPLPPAPTNSFNELMNHTYTPLTSPPIPSFNQLRSPVSVPPASVRAPSRIASCMGSPQIFDRSPSRIMHQPRPHPLVDLDCISSASIDFQPDPRSAPTVLTEFPCDVYGMDQSQPHTPFPMYYTNPPYPYSYPLPPHPNTPQFKIEYSSIHSTFLATIKDSDSLKDWKSWVKWNEGVWQAVANGFVLGHICDEPPLGTPQTEWNTPSLQPLLSSNPTCKEIEARLKWDKNNGWTSLILTAGLSDEA
ncbi:hypothetical protein C8J55DRAFT_556349 [Lentinula edodes]|uniref:Uncharacterized protein n=1 Tax=Lentinula lateritia TaxID=40482 RepID=A0A9W9DZM3_9AGAR|nr:hypothetical protein C8J55DRAFT_556349 [Lentinula edodes]